MSKHAALAADLRQRINPSYAAQRGTESYERRECAEAIEGLLAINAELLEALRDSWNPQISSAYRAAKARAAITKATGETE